MAHDAEIQKLQSKLMYLMRKMTDRRYWRRASIAQEISAGVDLKLWCGGDKKLDYDIFSRVLVELDEPRVLSPKDFDHAHLVDLINTRTRFQASEPIHLLEALRDTYCTALNVAPK